MENTIVEWQFEWNCGLLSVSEVRIVVLSDFLRGRSSRGACTSGNVNIMLRSRFPNARV